MLGSIAVRQQQLLKDRPATAPDRSSAGWLIIPLGAIVYAAVGLMVMGAGNDRGAYLTAGGIAMLAVCPPLAFRRYRTLGIWTFVLTSVAIGFPIRLTYVYLRIPSESAIDSFYLRGHGPLYFLYPSILAALSLLVLSLAFLAVDSGKGRPSTAQLFSPTRVRQVCAILAVISCTAFVLFVVGLGGIDLDALAVKRVTPQSLDVERTPIRSLGELRWLSNLALVGYLLLLITWRGQRGSANRLNWNQRTVLLLYFVIIVLVPIYSSQRGDVFTPILATAFVLGRTRNDPKRRLHWRSIILLGFLAVVLLQSMTVLRKGGGIERIPQAVSPSSLLAFSDTVVLTRHFADFSKTAHLVRLTPESLPWDNGRSIYAYLIGPIPRTVWPSKPIIHTGPFIGQFVYGQTFTTSGVPPGALGELYWGFGPIGMITGAALIGAALGLLERRFGRTIHPLDQPRLLMYAAAVVLVADNVLGVGVGYAALRFALAFVVVRVVVRLVRQGEDRTVTTLDQSP